VTLDPVVAALDPAVAIETTEGSEREETCVASSLTKIFLTVMTGRVEIGIWFGVVVECRNMSASILVTIWIVRMTVPTPGGGRNETTLLHTVCVPQKVSSSPTDATTCVRLVSNRGNSRFARRAIYLYVPL
jgi:hypothetical protein